MIALHVYICLKQRKHNKFFPACMHFCQEFLGKNGCMQENTFQEKYHLGNKHKICFSAVTSSANVTTNEPCIRTWHSNYILATLEFSYSSPPKSFYFR